MGLTAQLAALLEHAEHFAIAIVGLVGRRAVRFASALACAEDRVCQAMVLLSRQPFLMLPRACVAVVRADTELLSPPIANVTGFAYPGSAYVS